MIVQGGGIIGLGIDLSESARNITTQTVSAKTWVLLWSVTGLMSAPLQPPWTVAHQTLLSMSSPRQALEWVPLSQESSVRISPHLKSPALAGKLLPLSHPGKPAWGFSFSQNLNPYYPSEY